MINDKSLMEAYKDLRWLLENPKLPKEVLLSCYELSQHQTALFTTVIDKYGNFNIEPSSIFNGILVSLKQYYWPEVLRLVEKAKSWTSPYTNE